MKKIIYLIIICLTILIIYMNTKDNKIYYLALGDEITLGIDGNNFTDEIKNYLIKEKRYERINLEFAKINYRTTDLNNDINNNIKTIYEGKEITIKNAIIKADFITISIGTNDFINYKDNINVLNNNILNLKKDMKELLNNIRSICKEKIYLIGIYNPYKDNKKLDNSLKELNKLYSDLCLEYNITYIDLYDHVDNRYPNVLEYKYITNKLISSLKNDIILKEV